MHNTLQHTVYTYIDNVDSILIIHACMYLDYRAGDIQMNRACFTYIYMIFVRVSHIYSY